MAQLLSFGGKRKQADACGVRGYARSVAVSWVAVKRNEVVRLLNCRGDFFLVWPVVYVPNRLRWSFEF